MLSMLELKGIAFALALSGLVVYHYTDRHAAVKEAEAQRDADWNKKLDAANATAQADAAAKQAQIDKLAASSAPEIKAKVDKIAATLATLKDKPIVKYLPADCVLPPDQVAAYNSIK